jgi:hypothetical protein
MAVWLKKRESTVFKVELLVSGMRLKRLCPKRIINPRIPSVFVDTFKKSPRIIKPNPMAAITSKSIV